MTDPLGLINSLTLIISPSYREAEYLQSHLEKEDLRSEGVLNLEIALHKIKKKAPSLAIIDDAFGEPAIEDFLGRIASAGTKIEFISLVDTGDRSKALHYYKLGAAGCIFKDSLYYAAAALSAKKILSLKCGGNRSDSDVLAVDSAAIYYEIFSGSIDAVFVCNNNRGFINFNDAFCDLIGYYKDEILGLKLFNIFHKHEDYDKFIEQLNRLQSVKEFKGDFTTKTGKKITCLLKAGKLYSTDGKEIGFHCVIRDVTDEMIAARKLADKEDESAVFLDLINSVLLVTDSKANILNANKTLEFVTGKSRSEILGKNGFVAFSEEVNLLRRGMFEKAVQTGEIIEFEDEHLGLVLKVTMHPVKNEFGEVEKVYIKTEDMTPLRACEKTIKALKASIESSPNPIAVYDISGRIVAAGGLFNEHFKNIGADIGGENIEDFFPKGFNICDEIIFPSGEGETSLYLPGNQMELKIKKFPDNGNSTSLFLVEIGSSEN